MSRSCRLAITVLLVLTIAYVFISPAFALDASANRAWRAALQLMASIALMAFLLFELQVGHFSLLIESDFFAPRGSPTRLLGCVARC